jgi:hypothetical protein
MNFLAVLLCTNKSNQGWPSTGIGLVSNLFLPEPILGENPRAEQHAGDESDAVQACALPYGIPMNSLVFG